MRVGILTPTQPLGTPYSQAAKFVGRKELVKFLALGVIVEVVKNKLYRELVFEVSGRRTASIVEKQFARPAIRSCYVKRALPERQANENLDLAYPEAMRTTLLQKHPAMKAACDEVRRRNAQD